MDAIRIKLEEWLGPKLVENNFFLVDMKLLPGNKLQVFIDNNKGITIDECALISRYLGKNLETEKILGEHYMLEVSSPGLDQPLKVKKQYEKNIGREVEVLFHNGIKKWGILASVDEEEIVLEEIRNKIKFQTEINLNQIKNTRIKIKF